MYHSSRTVPAGKSAWESRDCVSSNQPATHHNAHLPSCRRLRAHSGLGCSPPQVLACAPAACLGFGCPAFKFADKGMAGCLNERARVGTIFEVRFMVFDSALPPNNATATRTVTIAAPCDATLAAEKFYCDYGDTWECSPISCEALAQVRKPRGAMSLSTCTAWSGHVQ